MSYKNTQHDKYQKFTNQLNDCEAISEIKMKLDHAPETPAQLDDQGAELIESQSQIKFFLEELDNKQQDDTQLENKDDEVEEYEPILNTQINVDQKNINQQKQQQNQKQIETLLQVQDKLQNKQNIDPLPSDNKLNQDIIQDDIDISQSKLCKSLLKNINDQAQNEDAELLISLYNELNEVKQKNKEMQIQNEFYQQELKRVKEQFQQDMSKQKQIFENEITHLKAQLTLAKKVNKQETQNLTMISFQERQLILRDMLNKITEKQNQERNSNINDQYQNQAKQDSTQIIKNQPQTQKDSSIGNMDQQKVLENNKVQSKDQLLQVDKKKKNVKEQESPQKQTITVEKKANPPPPPNKKQSKQVKKMPPDAQQDQLLLQDSQIKTETSNQQNRELPPQKQTTDNSEDFFNNLSNQTQLKGQDQQNQIKHVKEVNKEKTLKQPITEAKFVENNSENPQLSINNNNLLMNEVNSQIAQQDPFPQNQSQIHNQNSNQTQKQIPKQRRINQSGNVLQNVPSSLFD